MKLPIRWLVINTMMTLFFFPKQSVHQFTNFFPNHDIGVKYLLVSPMIGLNPKPCPRDLSSIRL